ncbi:hypothetical protein PA10_00050 [Pseudomonas phage pPa_SNUABM_DT01]|nr:hypothetical protein PA10_00050 [Pseudomonas phage pPa_SNUABM_DT01]
MDKKEVALYVGAAVVGTIIGTVTGNWLSKKLFHPLMCDCDKCKAENDALAAKGNK